MLHVLPAPLGKPMHTRATAKDLRQAWTADEKCIFYLLQGVRMWACKGRSVGRRVVERQLKYVKVTQTVRGKTMQAAG
jgi:hypothetical protein